MPDTPLRPDEDEYRTDVVTEDEAREGASATPAAEPRPWVTVGLVLLAIFLAILAYAVVLPAIR